MNKCIRCGRPATVIDKTLLTRYGEISFCLKCESSFTDIRECFDEIINIFMSGKDVGIDYWVRINADMEGDV